jgi:hypothetical protein
MQLRTKKKLGDQEVKGRVYTLDKNCLNEAICVPASNEPQARMPPTQHSIWEKQPGASPDFEPLYSDIPLSNDEIELPLLNQALNQSTDDTDDLIQPFSETNITDYGEENSGIEGLNPRWYTKTVFMQTPYGAQGIFAHADFLERYEDTMSSPSRKLSNKKFRKGAQIEANLGAIAKQQLQDKDSQDL